MNNTITFNKIEYNKPTNINYYAYFPSELEEILRIILSIIKESTDEIDQLITNLITTQLNKIKLEKLHIGKYMDGWQFCFCYYDNLTNFTKWIDFLSKQSVIIKDQSDNEISIEDFKNIVNKNVGKMTLFDHPNKKLLNINIDEYDHFSDDGYWFTKRNFG